MERSEIVDMAVSLSLEGLDEEMLADILDTHLASTEFTYDVEMVMVELTSGTAVYDYPSDAVDLLHGIMTDTDLILGDEAQLDAIDTNWRTTTGTPSILSADRLDRQYRLYPSPTTSSDDLIPIHGEPLGVDYPDGWLILFYQQDRELDLKTLYGMPLACKLLASAGDTLIDGDSDLSASAQALHTVMVQLLGGLNGK